MIKKEFVVEMNSYFKNSSPAWVEGGKSSHWVAVLRNCLQDLSSQSSLFQKQVK